MNNIGLTTGRNLTVFLSRWLHRFLKKLGTDTLGTDVNSTSIPHWFNIISLKLSGNVDLPSETPLLKVQAA